LLSLEFIGVIAYFNLYLNLRIIERELYFILVYLTFLVCEGALGLRLLVVQIRGVGADYLHVIRARK
jgi:NADH-ubiquinone oxidoreductase chain 4L